MSDITYTHVLDGEGRCNCGWYVGPPSTPGFTEAAHAHFIETTIKAVKDQTGWRGLWNQLRGKPNAKG